MSRPRRNRPPSPPAAHADREGGAPPGAAEAAADGPESAPGLGDLLAPGLRLVFVGFNPSLVAWRAGHYYANPVNNFYRLLHRHGLTPRLLEPREDRRLLEFGIGVCDLLAGHPSPQAGDYPGAAYREAVPSLRARLEAVRPRVVCFNGLGVARYVLGPSAAVGLWPGEPLAGASVWVVPSTSGAANRQWAAREEAFAGLAAFLRSLDATT